LVEMPKTSLASMIWKEMGCSAGVFEVSNHSERREKMNNTWKYLKFMACLTLLMVFIILPCTSYSKTKDKILIGNPIALSGINVAGATMSQTRAYDMWAEDVNAKGGIYVKEYNKKIPVKIIRYDDKSDIGTAVKLTEKLLLDDKVDFIFPPWGTASNFAIAPVINKYKSPVVAITCSSVKLRELAPTVPYMFILLNQPQEMGAALVELCKELGVKRAAVIHHTDLHGIEFASQVVPQAVAAGVDVLLYKSYPLGVKDLSPLLKEIKALKVDALLAFSYPPETFLITEQAKAIGLNPKLFYATVGVAYPSYRDKFGAKTVEGIMGSGVWNPKVSPAAKEWFDRYVKRWGEETDRWGTAGGYATGQILAQAIEKAGTLDPTKVRNVIASGETFDTVLCPVKFVDQFNINYPGQVGQWQNGEFLTVDKTNRQAKPIYPKSAWPK
jgi:branched-chain amino acid transport system substrate-binding protein